MTAVLLSEMRPLRAGLRAWFYRGQRRARRRQVGHLATGVALLGTVYLG